MKSFACGAALALLSLPAGAQRAETGFLDRTVEVAGTTYRYQVYVPAAYPASTNRWPVILYLHGAGERGADGLFQTAIGLPNAIRRAPDKYPAIVVMPQVPTDSLWLGAPADAAMAALDRTMSEFRGDPDRVYLTGLSMGGNGTWYLAYRHPERFAALAPVCGFVVPRPLLRDRRPIVPGDSADAYAALARRIGRVPTWIFHGEEDPVVPVSESRRMARALEGANARYTEFLGMGHNVWDATYGSSQFQGWLFAQRRSR